MKSLTNGQQVPKVTVASEANDVLHRNVYNVKYYYPTKIQALENV